MVEVSPEIADIDYNGLTLKRTNYKISDDEVDAQLKMLQQSMAQNEKIEPARPTQAGDFALIDYEGFKGGQPFAETAKTENFNLKVGQGTISKDFDDQLTGMQPEESKEFTVKFPEDYFNEKLKGLEISFQVTLNEIREEVLPAIDDVLAKKAGPYENLDGLQKAITENLEQGYAKRVDQELNEQIFTSLIEKSDFDVPDTMVDMELEGIVNEAERSFAYRNISLEEMGLTKESIAEKYRDTAVKQVKRHLILGKMIEQDDLSLSDDELEEALNEMAASFNQPVEEIKKYYDENKDKLKYFKHTILEKKAIKLIIDTSKIEDVEPENEPATDDESEKAAEEN
jgi:trigger factor